MKKILCILLALMMCVCLVACNNSEGAANKEVVRYVKEYGDELLASLEEGFDPTSGITYTTSIAAVDAGIVIDANINGTDEIPEEMKRQMQELYDAEQETFDTTLRELQAAIPALEYFQVNVNEEDGDLIAKMYAGAK